MSIPVAARKLRQEHAALTSCATADQATTFPCRLVLTRYIQWSVTTPTLIYVVSKISDFTRGQVSLVVMAQASVIWSGLISSIVPSPWKCELLDPPCLMSAAPAVQDLTLLLFILRGKLITGGTLQHSLIMLVVEQLLLLLLLSLLLLQAPCVPDIVCKIGVMLAATQDCSSMQSQDHAWFMTGAKFLFLMPLH